MANTAHTQTKISNEIILDKNETSMREIPNL